MKKEKEKDFYTTSELIKESWFPIKSYLTLKKLIEKGELDAIDVSTNPAIRRYRIRKASVKAFIERRKN